MKPTMEIVNVDRKTHEKLYRDFSIGPNDGMIQVGSKKLLVPVKYKEYAEKYANFEVRPTDVWVMGMPRSGTTLTEEMTWLICSDLDFERARTTNSYKRIPFLESNLFINDEKALKELALPSTDKDRRNFLECSIAPLEILSETKEKRVIKTHLPFELLPKEVANCKIVYVARNPKDVVVSFYHLHRTVSLRTYVGSFESYFHYYKDGLVTFTPYWNHIEQAWARRNDPNFKFIFYENLTGDLRNSVKDVSKFLGKDFTDDQLEQLASALEFDNFKKFRQQSVSAYKVSNDNTDFVRKGKVGGWKSYFENKQLNKEADDWIEENCKRIGIQYPCYN